MYIGTKLYPSASYLSPLWECVQFYVISDKFLAAGSPRESISLDI